MHADIILMAADVVEIAVRTGLILVLCILIMMMLSDGEELEGPNSAGVLCIVC
jgi:NADH:ubiquinone oxidoreductase subunit 6 (subunit J)